MSLILGCPQKGGPVKSMTVLMGGLLYHRQSALPHSAPALLAVVALTHLVLPPGSSLFVTPPPPGGWQRPPL